jgi:photosystem II stability/assembly factor-like uncharacterized protein
MADEVLILKGEGNVDVQVGGPGNAWQYLSACAHMSGPTVPLGGTEIRWCQDPNRAGGFMVSSEIETAADQISFDMMTKLGKVDYLQDLACTFSLRARFAKCGEREDPSNYDPIMLTYCPSRITERSYDDLVIADPGNNDEILVTTPVTATYEMRIKSVNAGRIGTNAATVGDQPINDAEYCDSESCPGYCGSRSDGCTVAWFITDTDAAPYANPNLIKMVKNMTTGALTWTVNPILPFNNNADGIECAGSRLLVSSNGDSVVAYNDNDGDQDDWNPITLGNAPAARHTALFARTAREIWVAAAAGYVYKSVDGGSTYTAMHAGDWTVENMNAVWAYDANLVYAVGNNGAMIKSNDGGETWDDITEVATTNNNLLVVIVPPGRPKEVFIGTNDGAVYRSTDEGDTFSQMSFTGDDVGTIDDLAFCGPCNGDVLYILHNDAGPRGRVLRDLSGGAGGADVETVAGYTDVVLAGIELNALSCCNANEVVVGGENYGGYPMILKVG